MTATDIILRARSVSDLPNSKFLSHLDELNSINEAWKDIYAVGTDNDDDYWVTRLTFALTVTFAVAGSNNEYLYPLPSDFFKLRYLDFRTAAADFLPMKKFNLGMKDDQPGDPYYRFEGQNLWITGGSVPSTGLTIRMGYYPTPATITAPQQPFVYGTSYTPTQFATVIAPCYAPYLQSMVYAYGNIITSENITNATVGTPVALFTDSGAVTNIVYYKGTLYWIRGGLIWYKPTALTAAFLTPTQATSPTGVVSFYIANTGTIYYSTAAAIRSCDLTGGTDALVSSTANVTSLAQIGPTTIYRTTASLVGTLAPVTTMYASGIAKVTSDGGASAMIYILDNAGNTRRVTYTALTAAIVTDDIVDSGVTDIGQVVYDINQVPATWIVPTLKSSNPYQQLLGVDGTVNYNFSYPNNLAPEIMAWRSAVDYRTKQGSDITMHLLKLGHPTNASEGNASGLWARFEQTIRRDDYKVERIRNAYSDRSFVR
jgi:hypothetical protein